MVEDVNVSIMVLWILSVIFAYVIGFVNGKKRGLNEGYIKATKKWINRNVNSSNRAQKLDPDSLKLPTKLK